MESVLKKTFMIKVGKTTFSKEAIKLMSKSDFIESVKHIDCNAENIWNEVNENTESNTGATVESSKDANTELSKEGNEVLVSAKGNSGLDHKAKHNRSALPKGDK